MYWMFNPAESWYSVELSDSETHNSIVPLFYYPKNDRNFVGVKKIVSHEFIINEV